VLRAAGHDVHERALVGTEISGQLAAIEAELHPDVYLNLCQGGLDEGRAGPYAPAALEAMGRPFTGASSVFYNMHKVETKRRMIAAGVETPAFLHVTTEDGIARAAETLRFPLFVKHHDGNNSIGVFRDNRVEDRAALDTVARRVIRDHGGALIEEYVDGREVAVLLVEDPENPDVPHVFEPLELGFPDGEQFFHFELKWGSYTRFALRPIEDEGLRARMAEAARRAWVACEGRSYARCDFRVDDAMRPWLLEINPQCCVFYPPDDYDIADLILARSEMGHAGFAERVLRSAVRGRSG
jgi:D-alanine-D-alanine ligase